MSILLTLTGFVELRLCFLNDEAVVVLRFPIQQHSCLSCWQEGAVLQRGPCCSFLLLTSKRPMYTFGVHEHSSPHSRTSHGRAGGSATLAAPFQPLQFALLAAEARAKQ